MVGSEIVGAGLVGGAVVGAVLVGGAVVGAVLVGGAEVGAVLVGGALVDVVFFGAGLVGALLVGANVAGCEFVTTVGNKPPDTAGVRWDARGEDLDGTTASALAEPLDAVGTCASPTGDGPPWDGL